MHPFFTHENITKPEGFLMFSQGQRKGALRTNGSTECQSWLLQNIKGGWKVANKWSGFFLKDYLTTVTDMQE